jgi:hypothetical protein
MKKINPGFILPSAAYTIGKKYVKSYEFSDKDPEIGDVVYGRILRTGQHAELENIYFCTLL